MMCKSVSCSSFYTCAQASVSMLCFSFNIHLFNSITHVPLFIWPQKCQNSSFLFLNYKRNTVVPQFIAGDASHKQLGIGEIQ